jgi:hypothetical protein
VVRIEPEDFTKPGSRPRGGVKHVDATSCTYISAVIGISSRGFEVAEN